jgi:hypothetical protein
MLVGHAGARSCDIRRSGGKPRGVDIVKKQTRKNNRVHCALYVAGVLALGANVAIAGEVNGKGKPIPGGEKGRSECSYSGQQDDPIADAGFFRGDRVQSWGQIPKMLRDILTSIGSNPGVACNPKKSGG